MVSSWPKFFSQCKSGLALVKFVQGYEDQLSARERLPLSTEILESCFAQYKHLPATLTSRRQLLYREAKPETKSNRQNRATPITTNE